MRIPSRLWLLSAALLLGACAVELPVANRDIVDPAAPSGSGAVQTSSARADISAVLAPLEDNVLTGSGSERFLGSGVLEFGSANAETTLTVFTEQHCGYCNEFSTTMLSWLRSDFPDTLRIRIVPMVLEKYPNSRSAAQAFVCAGRTGSGSAMFSLLAERENKHRSSVIEYAEELHMDADAFSGCLDAEETAAILAQQKAVADAAGITLVPTFVLNDEIRTGLPLYADLRGWIESRMQ